MSKHRSGELGTAASGLIGILVLVAVVYGLTAAWFSTGRDPGTSEQIGAPAAPAGPVTLAGSDAPVSDAPAAAAPTDEDPGATVYDKACTSCHTSGAAGAPRLGDDAAWRPRMAQGVDQMLRTAIDGKGAMPPRGACMGCSDEDLTAAIKYMLVQAGYEPAGP